MSRNRGRASGRGGLGQPLCFCTEIDPEIQKERCAIDILTLNDLFAALFRPAEGERPVVRQPRRPQREALFELFFPDELVARYADKSKSNLTWFFTSDARNKSVRRSLVALLSEDARSVTDETHRKCREALWPRAGHPVFDAAALRAALECVRVPAATDGKLRITRAGAGGAPGLLERFFDVDEAAALSRVILTLAVGADAPLNVMAEVWRDDADGEIDFMRQDDSVAGAVRYCRMLDLQGRRQRAFEGFEAVARRLDRPAQTVDESMLYCRLGEMLFTGDGCARDEKAAQAYDRLGCLDENPKSWLQLSAHLSGQEARRALEHAAELGYGPAIRQLGLAWMNGSARLATQRNLDTARRWFQRGMTVPGADGAECACMLGRLYEAQGERDAAVNAYRIAQEGGSAEAAERLARLDWVLSPEPAAGEAELPLNGGKGYCLTNGAEGCNRLFLEGLTGRWETTACGAGRDAALPAGARATEDSPEAVLRRLAPGVYWGGAPTFPALVIALMSDDRQKNLMDAVVLLSALQRLAQSLGERAWDLVDAVELYILADHDAGALLLDSAFAGMAPLYFKAWLCDPALDAADRLFSAAPLFLPRLRAPSDAPVRLKIIGCGEASMAVLLRALALPLPESAAATIDVHGPGTEAMARRFLQRCPGLRGDALTLCEPLPRFHECAPEEALTGALDGPEGLGDGDYYVVAVGDDATNLRLGALLRGELMKRNLRSDRPPFIAVHTAHPVARWLAGSLSAGTEAPSAPWCGQYELFPFGSMDMYAPRALREDALERRARQAHMLYIGAPNTRDARHAAMGDYYRRQLSRDTARMAALSLVYRMHLAGLSLSGWRLYGVGREEQRLGGEYTRWLKEGDHLQTALRDEHRRRNRALLALGWSRASLEDVVAYVGRGNPGPVLYPARLDPFLCPWEALEDGELLRGVRDILRARYPEKSVPDPRRAEEASLWDTERILGE